jgi:hypothetical protein
MDRGSRRLPVRGAAERRRLQRSRHRGIANERARAERLRDADLDDVDFRFGIDLDAQLLPQGNEYIRLRGIQERVEAVRKDVTTWPQAAARADAEEMLRLVERVYENEPDVFTKRSFLLEMAHSRQVGERVLELLESSS